jgi:hypothetical protein
MASKRFPFRPPGLVALSHEVAGDPLAIEPAIPVRYAGWEARLLQEENGLTGAISKDGANGHVGSLRWKDEDVCRDSI